MRAGQDEWRTVRDSRRGGMACPSDGPGRPDSEAVAGGMERRAGAAGRKDQRFGHRPRLALSADSLDHNRPRLKIKELFRLAFYVFTSALAPPLPSPMPAPLGRVGPSGHPPTPGLRCLRRHPGLRLLRRCPGLRLLCLLRRLPAFGSFVSFAGARSFLRSCLEKVRQEVRREVVEEVLGRCWRSSSSRRMSNGRV